jgi:hypothetical protein
MSKMDNLRAMREARYAQRQARGGESGGESGGQPAAPRPAPTRAAPPRSVDSRAGSPVELPDVDAGEALCGHRSISGRTCTRESGHAAKSHRYA